MMTRGTTMMQTSAMWYNLAGVYQPDMKTSITIASSSARALTERQFRATARLELRTFTALIPRRGELERLRLSNRPRCGAASGWRRSARCRPPKHENCDSGSDLKGKATCVCACVCVYIHKYIYIYIYASIYTYVYG